MATEGSVEYVASAHGMSRERAGATLSSRIKSRLREAGVDYDIQFSGHEDDNVRYDGPRDQYVCSASVKIHDDIALDELFSDADDVHTHPVQF